MSIYKIYRATNIINDKVYIGFDSNWPARRRVHLGNNKKTNFKFHRAIRKYGTAAFVWEVIYQSLDHHHALEEMEPFFIKEHNSVEEGYNIEPGGSGWRGDRNPSKNPDVIKGRRGENNFTKKPDYIETRIGDNHYHYDHTIYSWINKKSGQILMMTRFDFIRHVGAKNSNVCLLIQGKRNSTKGWKLLKS